MGVELDSGLASAASQHELVLGTTHNGQVHLEVAHLVLRDRCIVNLDLDFVALLDCASLWRDLDVLVDLTLPDEVKVEFTVVSEDHLLRLLFVDEELSEVESEGLA